MGHANLIDVREAHTEAHIHLIFVLIDSIDLVAQIAGWFVNL